MNTESANTIGESLSEVMNIAMTGVEGESSLLPDLIVNVKNIGSVMSLDELSQYLPFLEGYSLGEIGIYGGIVLVWLLCVIWVLRDASARSESIGYQIFSSLLIVFLSPLIGLPLYLAFRPLTYKWERGYWREALEQKLVMCPHCQALNAHNHKMCVWCGELLQVECKQCHADYQGHFAYCPKCGAPNLE